MTKGHLKGTGIPRVGMLLAGDRSYPSFAAFCEGLGALGYIEGETFEMEARFAAGQLDRLPSLAEELVALGVTEPLPEDEPRCATSSTWPHSPPSGAILSSEPSTTGS